MKIRVVMILCTVSMCAFAADSLPNVDSLLVDSTGADDHLFVGWPTVSQVVDSAIENLPSTIRNAHSWASRQRMAALIPVVRVEHVTGDANFVNSEVVTDPANDNKLTDLRSTDGIRPLDENSIWAQWDLSELLFDIDEVDGALAERQLAEFRMRLSEQVIQTYYGLRESRIRLARGTYAEKQDRLQVQTLADTQQAILDSLTDGFFSNYIKESSPAGKAGKP